MPVPGYCWPMSRWIGPALVLISAASFGFMALFRHIASDVSVPMLLCLRFGIGAAVMLLIVLVRGEAFPKGRTVMVLLAMGALGYFGESFLYFTALGYAPSGMVAMLLYTYPAVVTVLSVVFLKERLTPLRTLALVLAVLGSVLTAVPGLSDPEHPVRPLGVVLGLTCSLIYSVYVLVGSRLPKTAALPASAIVSAGASAMFALVLGVQAARVGNLEPLPQTAASWGAVLGLAIICTAIGITLFLAGLARIGPVRASTLSTFEPVATAIVGVVALREHLSLLQIAGSVLILAAAVMAARESEPRAASSTS